MGNVSRLRRVMLDSVSTVKTETSKSLSTGASISIGTNYGNVALGGNFNTTNIYDDTIKAIDEAKGVNEDKKAQAKAILEHAKTYAAPFLPVIADAIKKSLGL